MILKKLKLILFIIFIKKDKFNNIFLSQRIKGIQKYGKPIENCKLTDYNWEIMAIEELVDCYEYLKMLDKFKKNKK
jgi:hypothetical protein